MAIARLLYHLPKYAFIDEGTSAISSDVAGLLYDTCKKKGNGGRPCPARALTGSQFRD
jgi:ABC-type uncharacterized transport system fused permease/ATPase subunit